MVHKGMKKFFKENYMIIAYAIITIVLELLSLGFVGVRKSILTKPLYSIILFLFVISILYLIKNQKARLITASSFMLIQSIMLVGFAFLYYMNGTVFEWSMINQRYDAHGTLEKIVLEPGILIPCIISLIGFICVCGYFVYKQNLKKKKADNRSEIINADEVQDIQAYEQKQKKDKIKKRIKIGVSYGLCAIFALGLFIVPFIDAKSSSKSYKSFLYENNADRYQEVGVSANAIYEVLSSPHKRVTVEDDDYDTMTDFFFEKPLQTGDYFGVSKGNNFVYILVESWEWYPMYNDWYDYEIAKKLYPNLTALVEQSIVLSNFYQREKTDTSEMLSLVGSNPTGKYINYNFEDNAYPFSLPNLFKDSVTKNGNTLKQIKSFHQNTGSFYNRDRLHENLGFEQFVSIEEMEEKGLQNTWDKFDFESEGERTLDSKTIEIMKEEMFPMVQENEQFMSFWLTFSMHGYYAERENLKQEGYYARLDELGVLPEGESKNADFLRTYCATVMDFDKAIGLMMDELNKKGLLDRTTICMYSDHNTYYNNLSYYAKDIEVKTYDEDLYRVPCIIYDQKLRQAMIENDDIVSADNIYHSATVIDKFTTSADLIPTLLEIFGIKGWENLYLGTSIFNEEESIIYSRAYAVFVTDDIIAYSLIDKLWTSDDYDEEDFTIRATKHLQKLELLDKMYYGDYFSSCEYKIP